MTRTERNFSMREYWNRRAAELEPQLRFRGQTVADWETWRAAAVARLRELLGPFPASCPLDAEVAATVEDGDLVRERVVFNAEPHMAVPCHLLRPKNMPADGRQAAIICCHGHGPHGKDAVAGVRSGRDSEENIAAHNYNYGEQLARDGFLTLCPDLRGFGERRDGPDPFPGRDPCNVNFVKGALLGIYTLTLNIFDITRCVDYLETRPEIDRRRIGMMGLSQGGTMTTFASALEPRISAADIICYVNPWDMFGIRRANFCGAQVVPGLRRFFDTDDIAGLIAPRPLLVEMGIHDHCFYIQHCLAGFAGLERIYRAADAADDLWSDVFPGPHAFSGRRAFAFFRKYL